jgi:hypothetical protein
MSGLSAASLSGLVVNPPAAQTAGSGFVTFLPNPDDPGEPHGPLGPISRPGIIAIRT